MAGSSGNPLSHSVGWLALCCSFVLQLGDGGPISRECAMNKMRCSILTICVGHLMEACRTVGSSERSVSHMLG